MAVSLDADFPRHFAATDRFRRGVPRTFEVTTTHVTFLRSDGPTDPVLSLWRLDLESGREVRLVDARRLQADDDHLPDAERARRERMRETGSGITAYSQSADGTRLAFALGGQLWLWDGSEPRVIDTGGAVVDPRLDAAGRHVACVVDGSLRIFDFAEGRLRRTLERADSTVGLADFAAAEELQRSRGHWWSPTGDQIIAEVVDDSTVPLWHIADPARPEQEPRAHRYPHAGANNASCSLLLLDLTTGSEIPVAWDESVHEYLVDVRWQVGHEPLVTLADRAQTRMSSFLVDPTTGALTLAWESRGEPWLEVVVGTPAWLPDGRLLHVVDDLDADTRRLAIDGQPVTAPGFHVAAVVDAGADGVLVTGWTDPRCSTALLVAPDGSARALSDGFVHCQFAGNARVQVRTAFHPDRDGRDIEVLRDGAVVARITNGAESAVVPAPEYVTLGDRALRGVVLWPEQPVTGPLPVILSPYGGPHHVEVIAAAGTFADDQWLANQGFCVVVADGRGTPGRGLAWEQAMHHHLADIALEDQLAALDAVLALHGDRLDGTRVGIRGWSFGGFLAALALLTRPDRFRAAVAGAPVTEWRLYDTAYTERYLGHPSTQSEVYDANSLFPRVGALEGDLLLVHGLADDNVVAAHSLQLSGALLAAGKPHQFLPLAGVSHMTPQAVVTENLLRLQAEFFKRHLADCC